MLQAIHNKLTHPAVVQRYYLLERVIFILKLMTIILTIQALKEYHNYRVNGSNNEKNTSATKSICVSKYS